MNTPRLDDVEIAQLVHDVADGWTMPPVRLDAPTWRDRVRSPRARRAETVQGWFGRIGRAAGAAVALTVAATLVAVVVTLPPDDHAGKSPAASDGSTPGASDAARATPLPPLVRNGDPPAPSDVIVRIGANLDRGDFAVVDIATGSIGESLTGGRTGSEIQIRADGTLMCLCVTESGSAAGSPTTLTVEQVHMEADGTPISTRRVATFDGQPDPREDGLVRPDPLPNVLATASFSEGGRYGFVGWSERIGTDWGNGLLVVDLLDGRVVGQLALSNVTAGDEDSRRILQPPKVVGQAGEAIVIGRSWEEWTPPTGTADYRFESDAFRATLRNGVPEDLAPVPSIPAGDRLPVPEMAGCGDTIPSGGFLADGGMWVACARANNSETAVRRVTGSGEILPEIVVTGEGGIEGDATVLSRDKSTLYVWEPGSAQLTRIDLATGETGEGRSARADAEPLSAIGRWLAPVADAKTFLRSSVILSPDGARVYAIGVNPGAESGEVAGSTGVFVFDAVTLAPIAVYPPTADFVSLAVGGDGRFLYAAGSPGLDASGRRRVDQGASITVFDTRDGSVRLIAGQLGNDLITFGPEPLR